MENKKINLSEYNESNVPNGKDYRFAIVVSEWNPTVTQALYDGAYDTLIKHGVHPTEIVTKTVPGSFELSSGAHFLARHDKFDGIICLGCVIQGETRHFDFICDAVAHGVTNVSLQNNVPVIFGVLTTNTMEQALDRSGGKHGNKGVEAAITALKMAKFSNDLLSK